MPMQIGFNEKELMGLNIAIVCGNNGVRCCTIVSAVSLDFLKSKMKVETSFFKNLKKNTYIIIYHQFGMRRSACVMVNLYFLCNMCVLR
jgi:hypothetical protein